MTNILALPRKQSNSWNNRSSNRKSLQDIADSHPTANNEPQRKEETCTLLHPAIPSSHKFAATLLPSGYHALLMGEHPHKRVQDRAKPAAQTTKTPPPAFTNAHLAPSFIQPQGQGSIYLYCTPGSSAQISFTTPLPQADAPSSIRHRETTSTCTPAHTTSCPGLPHSTPRVSNS